MSKTKKQVKKSKEKPEEKKVKTSGDPIVEVFH